MPEAGELHARRRALRREMRGRRRAMGERERAGSEARIVDAVRSLGAYRHARHIAAFLAFDGEPALGKLMTTAAAQGKSIYLPVIQGGEMSFGALLEARDLVANDFGILEPRGTHLIDPRRLDLVLTPLVAFDAIGTRIGVGRAYYDRCFSFLRHRSHWRHPKLVGIAYGFQQVELLERTAWDVPLWGIATESGARTFATN